MKRFLATFALTCVFSVSAMAGTIPTCGLTSDEPPTPTTMESTAPGEIHSTDSTSPGDMPTCGLSVLLTVLDFVF